MQALRNRGFRLALVFPGLFGVAFAISGFLVSVPNPAVGGTCGPGKGSESAIVALFDPGSIGAGAEPPAADAADRADWMAFVGFLNSDHFAGGRPGRDGPGAEDSAACGTPSVTGADRGISAVRLPIAVTMTGCP
jgi:hypothetical protein